MPLQIRRKLRQRKRRLYKRIPARAGSDSSLPLGDVLCNAALLTSFDLRKLHIQDRILLSSSLKLYGLRYRAAMTAPISSLSINSNPTCFIVKLIGIG